MGNLNKQTKAIIGESMEKLLQVAENQNKKLKFNSRLMWWISISCLLNAIGTAILYFERYIN